MLRRQLLRSALLLPLGALAQSQKDAANSIATEPMSDSFPVLPPQLALDTLDAAHFDLSGLKALVDARPALANAAVDWRFGDWETPLAAASHMGGQRQPVPARQVNDSCATRRDRKKKTIPV